jgi:hypothetical protein
MDGNLIEKRACAFSGIQYNSYGYSVCFLCVVTAKGRVMQQPVPQVTALIQQCPPRINS